LIGDRDLADLEQRVQHALARGDAGDLDVVGYGEITLVLGWPRGAPTVACKRLPPFPDGAALASYRGVLDEYLGELCRRGVDVVPTELRVVAGGDGSSIGYCVQPLLPAATLLPEALRGAQPGPEHPALAAVARTAAGAVDPTVGLDAQVSNWAWDGDRLRYLDVTTPLLRDGHGRPRLDLGLFLAAMPAVLRAPVARFVLPGVVARYTQPRAVLLDLLGNLHKERLDAWVPAALEVVNRLVEPPITRDEVGRYYRADARLWRVMLALRRADRWWQRRVRRRAYPFLLPGRIER
jgi:hypothetical protein